MTAPDSPAPRPQMIERAFLIGKDIQHSLSPTIWQGVFTELGLAWTYGLRDVEVEELDAVLDELRNAQYVGANVTMPYKQWAYERADERDLWVERAGVCNWIAWRDGRWTSTNTDAQGCTALLSETEPVERALVLGAGGAAGAVLAALDGRASHVVVSARTRDKAERRAEHAATWLPAVTTVDWDDRIAAAAEADLIVNTTPIGMAQWPGSPLGDFVPSRDVRIMDAVYGRAPTVLETQADTWGVPFTCGIAFLEAQATALLSEFGVEHAPEGVVARQLSGAIGRDPRHWTRHES